METRPLRTHPETLLSSWAVLEERGDVPEEERISNAGVLRRVVSSLKLALEKNSLPPKKAPAYFFVMVAAMELAVMDKSLPRFIRFVTWLKSFASGGLSEQMTCKASFLGWFG
eukprot:11606516-Karenia_brevis.AAC.1